MATLSRWNELSSDETNRILLDITVSPAEGPAPPLIDTGNIDTSWLEGLLVSPQQQLLATMRFDAGALFESWLQGNPGSFNTRSRKTSLWEMAISHNCEAIVDVLAHVDPDGLENSSITDFSMLAGRPAIRSRLERKCFDRIAGRRSPRRSWRDGQGGLDRSPGL